MLDRLRKPVKKSARQPGPFPYYGATGIVDHIANYIFDEKLILLGEDGAKWAAGEQSAFSATGKYWVNNHAHVLRPDRSLILDEWLIYILNHQDLLPFVTGLTVPKLNQERMKLIPIPVPSLAEQRRIVAILDEAFAGIATATANAEKKLVDAQELFDTFCEAIFNDATGKLTRLEDACERVTVGHVGKTSQYYRPSGVPFLRTQNVSRSGLDLASLVYVTPEFHATLKKSRLCSGDILISRVVTDRINVAIIPPDLGEANCANVICVRPGKNVNPRYLSYLIQSKKSQSELLGRRKGSAQQVVNTSELKNWLIALPTLSDQNEILLKISEFDRYNKLLKDLVKDFIRLHDELRTSIISHAFEGRLVSQQKTVIA